MKKIKLLAKIRKKTGSKYCKKIRNKNELPAILYGYKKKNILIKIDHNDIYTKIIKNQENKNINFEIILNKKIFISKIKEIQKHPYKNKILHIDFIY